MLKLAKGFIRLGHDVRHISYSGLLSQLSPFKSRKLSACFYEKKVDRQIAQLAAHYQPDIVYISFAKFLDANTVGTIRKSCPKAVFIGGDGDPWPKLQGDRIRIAKELDILTATNDGEFLQDYRDAGVPKCIFMPNLCDPDTDHRYEVPEEWNTDILWTGKASHHADTSESFREKLLIELADRDNCTLYGCFGRPQIGGIDYFYAISGAKIGVNVNACRPVRLYHSDRLTHYLTCGTFVMARRIPDGDLLFADGVHLRYFDTIEEFFELADRYLKNDAERRKIADAGMKWVHEQFNCVKIAGYILELAEKGCYSARWFSKT